MSAFDVEIIEIEQYNRTRFHKVDSCDNDASLNFFNANNFFQKMQLFLNKLFGSYAILENTLRQDYKNVVIIKDLNKGNSFSMLSFEDCFGGDCRFELKHELIVWKFFV